MKYAPKKVFILENGNYIELTYAEFQLRKENDPSYGSKWFIPVQGCLLETNREQYADFYREKERQKYLCKLDEDIGLLSIEAFDTETDNGIDYIADTSEDIAETVAHTDLLDRLQKALQLLNTDDRDLILLHFYRNIPQTGIADRLGISQQAVSKRICKIGEKIKKLIEN